MSKYRVPAFLHVNVGGREVEMAFDKAMATPEYRGQIVAKSLTELEDWIDRWDSTLEYATEVCGDKLAKEAFTMAAALKAFRAKLGTQWPTWPNWMDEAK